MGGVISSPWEAGRQARRPGSDLLGVGQALVLGDAVRRDVPAAIVAGRGLVIAAVAVEGAAVEELLQAHPVVGAQRAGVERQRHLAAAAVALVQVVFLDDGGVMVVDAARHHPLPLHSGQAMPSCASMALRMKALLLGSLFRNSASSSSTLKATTAVFGGLRFIVSILMARELPPIIVTLENKHRKQ